MSVAACAEIVYKSDPARFLAAMASGREVREKLFPLYAFNVEVSRAPWVTQEPLIAQMRLQWWIDVLDQIAAGEPVRKHEVSTPLSQLLTPDQATRLKSVASARQWDIDREGFTDIGGLVTHLEKTAGRLAEISAEVLSGKPVPSALDLGVAHGCAIWLLATPALKTLGCQPLPGDWEETSTKLAQIGLDRWMASRTANNVPKRAAPAMLVAFDAPLILRQVVRSPERVAQGSLGVSPFRQRLRLLTLSTFASW